MSSGLHIAISAETVFYLLGIPFSNSMLTSLIVSGLLICLAMLAKISLKTNAINRPPNGWQNFLEMLVEGLFNFVNSITNNALKTKAFFPIIASFFLFIVLNNWLGLLPGVGTIGITHEPQHANIVSQVQAVEEHGGEDHVGAEDFQPQHSGDTEPYQETHAKFIPIFRAGTADLNTTLALAIVSVFLTQIYGVKYLSLGYFKKFLNFSNPIMFVVGILETVSEFAKIISFAFRLFGNIFAGEVLLAVIASLIPVVVPMPFYGLEIFVGFIQALVFMMLSLVFFNMATISHEEH